MVDAIESLFLIKKKEGSVHIVVLSQLNEIADSVNSSINPTAGDRRLTLMNNGRENLFETISQGFGQDLYITVQQGNGMLIEKIVGRTPIFIQKFEIAEITQGGNLHRRPQ